MSRSEVLDRQALATLRTLPTSESERTLVLL